MSAIRTVSTHILISSALFLLMGCAAANKAQVNGQGFGGGDQLAALLASARDEAESEVGRLLRQEESSGLGDYRYCVTAFVCGMLQKLAMDEAKLAYVQTYFRSPTQLQKLADAFRSAKVVLTENSEDTQGNQAYAAGGVVKVLISKVQGAVLEDLIALMIHEHLHLAGVFGNAPIGGMTVEEFANAGGSAVSANRNKRRGVSPSSAQNSAPIVIFNDDFSNAGGMPLTNLWETITAGFSIQNGALFTGTNPDSTSRVRGVTRRDVSVRAYVDLGDQDFSWTHVQFRHRDDANHYLVGFGQRRGQDYDVSLYVRENGTYRTLSQNYFPNTGPADVRGDLRVDAVGNRLTVYYKGTRVAVVDDTTFPLAGGLALKGYRAIIDNYQALVP